MNNVLIVDVETTGLDREKDQVVELGYILWSVRHRTIIEMHSVLMAAPDNPAEGVNGIPAALLRELEVPGMMVEWDRFAVVAREADALVAHQADFDRAFCGTEGKVWICTREDMRWPKAGTGERLIDTALAHGVPVVSAHRALSDCLLIARLLEVVPDSGERLQAAFKHAKLPKHRYVAATSFAERELPKAAGFKWDPNRKQWWRVLTEPDAAALPFATRVSP